MEFRRFGAADMRVFTDVAMPQTSRREFAVQAMVAALRPREVRALYDRSPGMRDNNLGAP
jgi:hypothetical protein